MMSPSITSFPEVKACMAGSLPLIMALKSAAAIIVVLLVGGNLIFYLPGQLVAHRSFNFVDGQPRAQVEAEINGKALVFIENKATNWWEYGRFFSGNTPWLDGRIIYARDLGDEMNGRLLPYFPDYQPYRWQDGQLTPFK